MRILLDIVSSSVTTKDNAIAKDKLDFLTYTREEYFFIEKVGYFILDFSGTVSSCGIVSKSAAAKFTFATKNKVARG